MSRTRGLSGSSIDCRPGNGLTWARSLALALTTAALALPSQLIGCRSEQEQPDGRREVAERLATQGAVDAEADGSVPTHAAITVVSDDAEPSPSLDAVVPPVAPTASCREIETTLCPADHPHLYECTQTGVPPSSDCVSSGQIPLLGFASRRCCQ